ncbi:MAG: hypothetical protein WCY93_07745 [Anaerolineaceae bacterium]
MKAYLPNLGRNGVAERTIDLPCIEVWDSLTSDHRFHIWRQGDYYRIRLAKGEYDTIVEFLEIQLIVHQIWTKRRFVLLNYVTEVRYFKILHELLGRQLLFKRAGGGYVVAIGSGSFNLVEFRKRLEENDPELMIYLGDQDE